MSYNLFLDDLRKPEHAYLYPKRDDNKLIIESHSLQNVSGIDHDDWVIARNYDEFVFLVQKELPAAVSFDHDLHKEHIEHYMKTTQHTGVIEYGNMTHKTGKHCAEFFVQQLRLQKPEQLPKVFVHSANKYGGQEIKNVLSEFYDLQA